MYLGGGGSRHLPPHSPWPGAIQALACGQGPGEPALVLTLVVVPWTPPRGAGAFPLKSPGPPPTPPGPPPTTPGPTDTPSPRRHLQAPPTPPVLPDTQGPLRRPRCGGRRGRARSVSLPGMGAGAPVGEASSGAPGRPGTLLQSSLTTPERDGEPHSRKLHVTQNKSLNKITLQPDALCKCSKTHLPGAKGGRLPRAPAGWGAMQGPPGSQGGQHCCRDGPRDQISLCGARSASAAARTTAGGPGGTDRPRQLAGSSGR